MPIKINGVQSKLSLFPIIIVTEFNWWFKLFSQGTRSSTQVQLVGMLMIYKIRIVSVLHTLSRTQISTLPTISGKLCGIRVGRLMGSCLCL